MDLMLKSTLIRNVPYGMADATTRSSCGFGYCATHLPDGAKSGIFRACSCLFGALSRGEFQVVTSTLTLTEVLVHPLRSGNVELAGQYRDILLDQENLITVSSRAKLIS
jgi:hypothetical protein